jgi:mRNA-degrading endonuclease toxin of MazEF toxin-antitoxin module
MRIVVTGGSGEAGQAGVRRALVVSNEPFHRSNPAQVCPISASRSEPRYPLEIVIPRGHAGQTKDALILCQHVRTIGLERSTATAVGGRTIQYVTDSDIRTQVRETRAHELGLDIPLGVDLSISRCYQPHQDGCQGAGGPPVARGGVERTGARVFDPTAALG